MEFQARRQRFLQPIWGVQDSFGRRNGQGWVTAQLRDCQVGQRCGQSSGVFGAECREGELWKVLPHHDCFLCVWVFQHDVEGRSSRESSNKSVTSRCRRDGTEADTITARNRSRFQLGGTHVSQLLAHPLRLLLRVCPKYCGLGAREAVSLVSTEETGLKPV